MPGGTSNGCSSKPAKTPHDPPYSMTSTEFILLLGVMPALLVCSGIISGSETALFGLTQADRVLIKNNSPRAFSFVEALHR